MQQIPSAKGILQPRPAFGILQISVIAGTRVLGELQHTHRLKHESQSTFKVSWLLALVCDSIFIRYSIGSMRCHTGMKRGPASFKPLLSIIPTLNETHEFRHAVAMKPRRTQRIRIGRHDAVWKNDKICQCLTWCRTSASEDSVNAGIQMIVRNASDRTKLCEIVFEG